MQVLNVILHYLLALAGLLAAWAVLGCAVFWLFTRWQRRVWDKTIPRIPHSERLQIRREV